MPYFRQRTHLGAAGVLLATLCTTAGCAGSTARTAEPVRGHPANGWHLTIPYFGGRPFGIRVSSANKLAVTHQDLNTLTLLDPGGRGARMGTIVGDDPGEVVFNRSGTIAFVSGFNDGLVRLVNVANGSSRGEIVVGENAYRLALSPDESRLYVSAMNGALYVVSPTLLGHVGGTQFAPIGALQGLALSTNGEILYVSSAAGIVFRLSALTLDHISINSVGGMPQDVALTADGSEVVIANEGGWVDILDGATLASRHRIQTPRGMYPFGLALSPDDAHIYVTAPTAGEVIVIDRATRAIVRTIRVDGKPRRVTFSPDGLTAFVANEGGWVDVIK